MGHPLRIEIPTSTLTITLLLSPDRLREKLEKNNLHVKEKYIEIKI